MGAVPTANRNLIENSPIIKPDKSKICSWIPPVEDQKIGSTSAITPAGSSDAGFLQRAAKGGNEEGIRDYLKTQLRQGRSITIPIDGAFFDDGTFVGPNTTGYYEQIEAQVKAKRDILQEISDAVKEGKTTDEVFNSLEQYRSQP